MIGIRELSRQLSRSIEAVEETGRPLLITRHGKPVAAIVRIDAAELEEFILSNAPEFVDAMREADRDLAAGKTLSHEDLMAQIDAEEAKAKKPSTRRPTAAR
jgi:prevent-host-death family protein